MMKWPAVLIFFVNFEMNSDDKDIVITSNTRKRWEANRARQETNAPEMSKPLPRRTPVSFVYRWQDEQPSMALDQYLRFKIKEHDKTNRKPLTSSTIKLYSKIVVLFYEQYGHGRDLLEYLNCYETVIGHIELACANTQSQSMSVFAVAATLEAFGGDEAVIAQYRAKADELDGVIVID